MAGMVKGFHKRLQFVGEAAKNRRAAAAQIEKQLMGIPKAVADATVDYLVGSEIRQRLAKRPMSKRTKILLEALSTGRTQALRAVLSDPLGAELIEAEFLQRMQTEHAKNPDGGRQWKVMETLVVVSELLQQLTGAIEAQFSHYDELPVFKGSPTHQSEMTFPDSHAAPAKGPADVLPAGGVRALK